MVSRIFLAVFTLAGSERCPRPHGARYRSQRVHEGSGAEDMDMDVVDRRLIEALRSDGRASYAELARMVGLSSSAVHERVAKLESTGVITGFMATVDPALIGLGVTALVGIEPGEYGRDDDIAAALEAVPEVESCYGVAGDEAFVVQVRVATVDHLHRCLGRLRAIEGVARTRTTVVLATRFENRPARESKVFDGD